MRPLTILPSFSSNISAWYWSEITLDGPPGPERRASGTWYLWQPCTRRSSNGTEWQAWLTGTYADTYVKVGGTWKFETVTVDARWLSGPPPVEMPVR